MKDNQIDRLFKERLENQKTAPPAHLWEQIEETLPKKSKKAVYISWAVAASILVLTSFGYLALSSNNEANGPAQLADNEVKSPLSEDDTAAQKVEKQEPENQQLNQLAVVKTTPKTMSIPSLATKEAEISVTQQLELPEPTAYQPRLEIIAAITPKPTALKSIVLTDVLRMPSGLFLRSNSYAMSESAFQKIQKSSSRFGFVRSVASIAKSVDRGAEALSEFREAKNEWVNETLISEDEFKDIPKNNPLNK